MNNKIGKKNYSVHGINNVCELLRLQKDKIISIFLQKDSRAMKNIHIKQGISELKAKCIILDRHEFNKKFSNIRSQGVVIKFKFTTNKHLPYFKDENICLLIPESVQDPQNLGQIIRTSECAGINGLLLPKNRSVGITDSVLQVSQGAFLNLPIYTIGNIVQTLMTLKKEGFWVIGIENGVDASNWYNLDYHGKIILIFGSEGKGIRSSILKHCDSIATIPMLGTTNSLNVTAAVSAILFERNRQLSIKNKL